KFLRFILRSADAAGKLPYFINIRQGNLVRFVETVVRLYADGLAFMKLKPLIDDAVGSDEDIGFVRFQIGKMLHEPPYNVSTVFIRRHGIAFRRKSPEFPVP